MLTDEEIRRAVLGIKTDPNTIAPIARAIESAATAPLLAEIERLKERVKELEAPPAATTEPTRPANSQDWAGMDASTAFLLIQRHADGWPDIDLMMNEWRIANPSNAQPSQEEPRHMWNGSPVPNYTITREQ